MRLNFYLVGSNLVDLLKFAPQDKPAVPRCTCGEKKLNHDIMHEDDEEEEEDGDQNDDDDDDDTSIKRRHPLVRSNISEMFCRCSGHQSSLQCNTLLNFAELCCTLLNFTELC